MNNRLVIFLMAMLFLLFKINTRAQHTFPSAEEIKNSKLTYRIIDGPQHTFGYDILRNDTLFIRQSVKPAMQGNTGFKSKKDASDVAEYVISKMYKGEVPPSISLEEMKKLNIQ